MIKFSGFILALFFTVVLSSFYVPYQISASIGCVIWWLFVKLVRYGSTNYKEYNSPPPIPKSYNKPTSTVVPLVGMDLQAPKPVRNIVPDMMPDMSPPNMMPDMNEKYKPKDPPVLF